MKKVHLSPAPPETYQDILRNDETGVPKFLEPQGDFKVETAPISSKRYYSREFYDLENAHLWPRVWQMACLNADIPDIGDCFHYEIADRSFIIAHTKSGIKAFYNACLHRGRKLITGHCSKSEFVCPFHAITWSLDGQVTYNPIAWDLPNWTDENSRLPEARVAEWGGFIFINMDENAPDFADIAEPMIKDLEPFDWENRYRAFWFEKHIRANWKTTMEPFMESHHSQTTHPQLVPAIGDINSFYDFPNAYISRQISAAAVASPAMEPQPTEHEKLGFMKKREDHRVSGVDIESLPEDFRARTYLAQHARESLTRDTGRDHSHASDAEVLDYILYGVFPHMTFWGGYGGKLVYRWRPEPGNPEGSIMDIMFMALIPEGAERPKAANKIVLEYDDKMSSSSVGPQSLKTVFDQDFGNIPHIQTGLKSLKSEQVNMSQYTESRIRFLHHFIDKFIDTGKRGEPVPGAKLD